MIRYFKNNQKNFVRKEFFNCGPVYNYKLAKILFKTIDIICEPNIDFHKLKFSSKQFKLIYFHEMKVSRFNRQKSTPQKEKKLQKNKIL